MKKIISKILIILIVFIIVFEFICSSTVSAGNELEQTINATTNLLGGVVSIIFWIPRILITGLSFILNMIMQGIAAGERTNC